MPLRLNEVTALTPAGHVGPDNWLDSRQRVFINSSAFQIIQRDMRRYVRREIEGRAYLIAGHRGAGKTALVLRAVQDLRFEILNGSPTDQRPVLVKLHGPSLFSGELPAPRPKTPAATNNAPPPPPEPVDPLRAALAQITVALYRAVAREVVDSFRFQVMPLRGPGSDSQKLELAALLNLELDNGTTAAVLRGFWQKLNRLETGILWPADWNAVRPDQGLREIVAIATASQAFQVCIGAIDYKTTSSNSNSATETLKTGLTLEAGPALNRLAGLLGGAAIGGGLAAGGVSAAPAAAAALATGLISAATFAAAGSRGRDRAQSASYEFIRDYSITTLERDLPVVIERLRNAGLTPVFLVDELDKLIEPAAPQTADGQAPPPAPADRLAQLIDRLKNLTTDYGFFCFLTNRDYYEEIRSKFRAGAYPREYTYFSNLQFVLCSAADQLRYVLHAVACTLDDTDRDAPAHWMTLAFAVRLRSRMNVIALMRELNRHFDDTGSLRPEFRAIATLPRYRLAAAMQMVIDLALALAEPDMQARIEEDPLFGQLAVDALYCLPAALEDGKSGVCLAEPDLTAYLRNRSEKSAMGGAAVDQISPSERETIARLAIGAARALADFATLATTAATYWTPDRQARLLPVTAASDIIANALATFPTLMPPATPHPGLLREDPNQEGHFTFLLDRFFGPQNLPAIPATPRTDRVPRRVAIIGAARALIGDPAQVGSQGAFTELMLTIPFLRELAILSPSVPDEAAVRDAIRLASPTEAGSPDPFSTIETFVEACAQAAPLIAWASLLARSVDDTAANLATLRNDVPPEPYTLGALHAGIARHIRVWNTAPGELTVLDAAGFSFLELAANAPLQILPRIAALDADAIAAWQGFASSLLPVPIDLAVLQSNPWSYWRGATERWLAFGGLIQTVPLFLPPEQLVLSARSIAPACLFRNQLNTMSILDWSTIAASFFMLPSSAPPSANHTPGWALIVALRALGFGAKILLETLSKLISDFPGYTPFDDRPFAEQLIAGAAPMPPAASVLYIIESPGHTLADEPPPNDGRAVFAIRRGTTADASRLLDFLAQSSQFEKTVL